jgi:hypothetical protein
MPEEIPIYSIDNRPAIEKKLVQEACIVTDKALQEMYKIISDAVGPIEDSPCGPLVDDSLAKQKILDEISDDDWISSFPTAIQPQLRAFIEGKRKELADHHKLAISVDQMLKEMDEASQPPVPPTVEQLKAEGEAFKKTLAPRTSKERAKEIATEADKQRKQMLEEYHISDSEELQFLRNMIKSQNMDKWSPEKRLQYIDSLVAWAYDETDKNMKAMVDKLQLEIAKKYAEMQKLEEELTALTGKHKHDA